nr:hypothetical protein [Tanacetum cinerariifolium]
MHPNTALLLKLFLNQFTQLIRHFTFKIIESVGGSKILEELTTKGITLDSVHDDADNEMFDVDALDGQEMFVAGQNENIVEEVVDSDQDKGKGIMIEEPVKPKKKDQIRLNEEAAKKLQAEFNDEERLTREKAKKEQETNIDLNETWDDIQAKIDADHQLAERLQAQEQEELSDAEKATLFQ